MAAKRPKKPVRAKRPVARPSAKRAPAHRAVPSAQPARTSGSKRAGKAGPATAPTSVESPAAFRNPDERRHVLSLSFVRDGDEFLARIETDRRPRWHG